MQCTRLKECHKLANDRQGLCLSTEYIKQNTSMQWKCKEESHMPWFATFTKIKNGGTWCPFCAKNVKLTLKECQDFAISREGECLSTEYINARTSMQWKCKENHTWWAWFDTVKNGGSWCLICSGNAKLSLKECQELANDRQGLCLSTEYKNKETRMQWKCKEESHMPWFATFGTVKNGGTWCPTCSGHDKLTLEECQKLAISREGECLSTEYINSQTHMEWKCKENHTWIATFTKIKNGGTWCPFCAKNVKLTLKECQDLAISRGGECLSIEYINAHISIEWKCKENHTWIAKFNGVKHANTWCPTCSGHDKLTLEECQKLAISREGECLSTEYINSQTHMEWKCKENHTWIANFNSVKHANTWCPTCSKSRSEKLSREILEEYTGLSFPSIRPNWLKNISGYNLELDGFCEDLSFAFEYQGKQHCEYIHHFHRKEEDFKRQQERDKLKLKLCKKHNIDVLIIPHTLSYQNENELRIFIKEELIKRLNCKFLFLE